uniref:Uncharacterized protein n=1 Tax=Rhizophora mucronata TaxID=61149 RepID=A0A2P2PAF3_RHIMU
MQAIIVTFCSHFFLIPIVNVTLPLTNKSVIN